MSKFTTVIHIKDHPAQYLVPGRSIHEVAEDLQKHAIEGKPYYILDTDPNETGASICILPWEITKVYLITRVDLDAMRVAQEKAQTQAKLGIAPS